MTKKEIATGVVPVFARKLRTGRHKVPADLRKTLTSSPAVLAAWKDITQLARNEWICWVISAKKPETRSHRIDRTRTELIEGMRRPCCWIGCQHR